MHANTLDAMARTAGSVRDRRASLKALGLAALGATAVPSLAQAGKAGKKAKKKCQRQRGQCQTFVETSLCVEPARGAGVDVSGEGAVVVSCVEFFRPCCDFFAQCQAGQGLSCLHQAA
jgi:hypothetical protein